MSILDTENLGFDANLKEVSKVDNFSLLRIEPKPKQITTMTRRKTTTKKTTFM